MKNYLLPSLFSTTMALLFPMQNSEKPESEPVALTAAQDEKPAENPFKAEKAVVAAPESGAGFKVEERITLDGIRKVVREELDRPRAVASAPAVVSRPAVVSSNSGGSTGSASAGSTGSVSYSTNSWVSSPSYPVPQSQVTYSAPAVTYSYPTTVTYPQTTTTTRGRIFGGTVTRTMTTPQTCRIINGQRVCN